MNRLLKYRIHTAGVLAALACLSGCVSQQELGELQQRRVDIPQPTGVDESIDDRFGLSADAQDPTKRDQEMGYGRWKAKPEPKGTAAPTKPTRRGSSWGATP